MCGDSLSSDPPKRFAYNIAVAIFAYIAPLITIFYSYFRILYVLQKRCDRRTFRFAKCHGSSSTRSYDTNKTTYQLKSSSTKSFNHERQKSTEKSLLQDEINTHNTKTITRAKLKTLKLTALIGKNLFYNKRKNKSFLIIFFFFSHLFYSLLDTLLLYCLFSSYN